jgi:rubrerythrin
MRYILEPEKPKLKKKVLEDQKKLINNMLIIYENLLRDFNSDSSNQENIRVEVFPLLNKLMKFVIKYNLVDAYLVERYFTVVEDTIKLFNQNKAKTQIKEEEPMLKRKVSASLTGLINEDEIKHSFNLLSLTENEHHNRFMEDEEVKENARSVKALMALS